MTNPSAGVPLARKRIHCPRCGIDKGDSSARVGLCHDCHLALSLRERREWG